jgi:hypothetical protein
MERLLLSPTNSSTGPHGHPLMCYLCLRTFVTYVSGPYTQTPPAWGFRPLLTLLSLRAPRRGLPAPAICCDLGAMRAR